MSHGAQLDSLAARWADHPDQGTFAALAEGLRKRGALGEASAVALSGLTRFPEFVPGLMVLARIRRDEGDLPAAEAALRSALACDPSHPVVLDALADLARTAGRSGDAHAWTEARDATTPDREHGSGIELTAVMTEFPPDPPPAPSVEFEGEPLFFSEEADGDDEHEFGEPMLTESLAMLYLEQGHLDRALDVFNALATRDPGNLELRARRDALVAELAGRRPRPYDSRKSGGKSVHGWLAALAAARPLAHQSPAGYDAFFQAPPPPPDETADIGAFQAWLKDLGR